MECDDDIIASFCFPFTIVKKGRLESTTILVASAEVKGGGGVGIGTGSRLMYHGGWC